MVCGENDPQVPTGSETDPMTGNQSWSIPVTAWPYKGRSYGLTLSYSSAGMVDPNNPDLLNLAGLSERNSRWSHNFAMWLTLPMDETGAGWAVVHRPGHALTFKKPASGVQYAALESFDTLAASATNLSPAPTVTYPCNGTQATATVPLPSSFTLTDRDGTQYLFSPVASGGTAPIWQISECTAIPVYVLTKITDRWQREVDLTWTDVLGGGAGWRVTQVSNPGGPTLTLTYSGTAGLLHSAHLSTDPAGVDCVTVGVSPVNDETDTPRQKLTSLTVRGPAGIATNGRSRTWSFVYRDPATENTAYSGTVTGDLVIRKTQPDGLTYSYVYDTVHLPRATSADYDGRFLSVSWPDNSEGTNATRTISRAMSGSQATFTFPGGVQTQYTYSGSDLTQRTELANTPAPRTWN